jgi:hypothetical protein
LNSTLRLVVFGVACAAFLAGCRDDDDGSDPDDNDLGPAGRGAVSLVYFEDFEEGFPSPSWEVVEGFPFADEERGNAPPGLVLGLFVRSRAQTTFTFSTAEAVTVSFDLATPGVLTESDSRFKLRFRRELFLAGEASFEVTLQDGQMRFEILGGGESFDFFTDQAFRTIEFSVDRGLATWSVNGQPFMVRTGFPEDHFFIDVEANGGQTLGFVVDNVTITRP